MSREKETILDILKLYKNMPFLWDKNNENYTNKKCRCDGNNELLEVYKDYDRNATVKTMTKKISNLRTFYFRELKKVKESNGVYVPTLWYFDAFKFLDASSEPHRSTRDPLETEALSPSSSDTEGNYQRASETSSPPQEKKFKISNANLLQTQNDNIIKTAENFLPMKEEEWQILGKSIGLQLRDLDKMQLTIAQKIISDTIYYAKVGLLSGDSFVALGSSSTHTLPYASPCIKDQRQVCCCHHPFPKQLNQATRSDSPSSP